MTGNRMRRVGGRCHTTEGHRLDLNPRLLQRRQSLCTWEARKPDLDGNSCFTFEHLMCVLHLLWTELFSVLKNVLNPLFSPSLCISWFADWPWKINYVIWTASYLTDCDLMQQRGRGTLCPLCCVKLLIPGKRKHWLSLHLFSGMCKEACVLQRRPELEVVATQGAYRPPNSYNYVKSFLPMFALFAYVMQWSHMLPIHRRQSRANKHKNLPAPFIFQGTDKHIKTWLTPIGVFVL